MAKVWDELDNEFLKKNYLKLSNQELAEKFGVSKKSIQGKLRRLGLHRASEEKSSFDDDHELDDESSDDLIEIQQLRPKRLAINIPAPPAKEKKPVKYVPRELTERYKRAIREFNNAINFIKDGEIKKGIEELEFIIRTFTSEIEICERAKMYHKMISKKLWYDIEEPDTEDGYYNLGVWYYNHSKIDDARHCFEKALEIEPEHADSYYNLACMALKRQSSDEALDLLEKAISLDERLVETAINDDDFEKLWTEERFVELIRAYVREN
ncbi:tetratricopeptide repeat protein [bacterium]|nr:tetratricopeptide repeat protein [candidate division CSSED10-310 bacterium]